MDYEANEREVNVMDSVTTEIKEEKNNRSDSDTKKIRDLRRGINSLRADKRTLFKPSWDYIESVEAMATTAVDLAEDLCMRLRLSGNNLYQKDNAAWQREYDELYRKYSEAKHNETISKNELKSATASHQAEIKELNARIEELENDLEASENNPYLAQLKEVNAKLMADLEYAREESEAREEYVSKLEAHSRYLQSRFDVGQEKLLQKALHEKKTLAFQVNAYEQERASLYDQLDEKDAEIAELKMMLEELRAKQDPEDKTQKPTVVYSNPLPEETVKGIIEDLKANMSKNKIATKWHVGKGRIDQVIAMAAI